MMAIRPLTFAAGKGLEKVCELLISKMSNQAINQVNNYGYTALTLAANKGLEKVCEVLIPKMNDQAINQVTNDGYTALTFAAGKGLEKVCELLISKMSDQAINQVTTNGVTALTFAAGKGLEKVCELFIPKMTEQAINQVTTNGNTALTLAASNGLEKVCELLIPKMTDQAINQVTTNGNTALTFAARKGLDKVCEMLTPKLSNQQPKLKELEQITKQTEETMKNEQAIIQDIFKLIAEGNARIKDNEEKGILILGKTGVGKSTLTYLLAGEDLRAVENDTGDLCLEAVKPYGNIKINHTTISETKIPNKYKAGDITIWDCPGFMDTEGIAQEVANTFYIQRLFAANKQLKFVLAIPESVLKSKADLLPIVDQFTNGFNSIEALKNSVSLIVTKAAPHKKAIHIQTAIDNLIAQNSQHIKPKTLEMLNFLSKSIQIFHCPTNEGLIKNSSLLKTINDHAIKKRTDRIKILCIIFFPLIWSLII